MNRIVQPVGIWGIGSALPPRVLSNRDLEQIVETTDEWIRTRTGIRERRITDEETTTSVLAIEAAKRALADAQVEAGEIDLILVGTVTPDMMFPSAACLVQAGIGAERAAAMDVSAACPGFLHALAIGEQFIANGTYRRALVIGAETLSKITDWRDRSTCVLFGDAAGAAVLGPVKEGRGLLAHVLGADGRGADLLKLPAGGSRLPASQETVERRLHYLQMNGPEVFKFAVRIMGEAALEVLAKAGLTKEDVDFLVPHQANLRIIESAMKRLDLPWEKVVVTLDRYGNTSSASIPVALEEAVRAGRVRDGHLVVMVAFGAGLTWAATALRWGR